MDVKQPTPVRMILPRWKRLDCADGWREKSFCNKTRSRCKLQEWEDQCSICADKDSTATAAPPWLGSGLWSWCPRSFSLRRLFRACSAGRNLPGKASSWEMDPDPIHPQKTEKTNTMADTQNQLWRHIQTLHNVKKNSCVAVVHTPSTGVFKHTSLAVMLYGITKCNIYQRT